MALRSIFINNIGQHEVNFSDRIRNCEDVLLMEEHHLAILACDAGRESWNTVMGVFTGNVTENARLWAYDYETTYSQSLKPISLAGFPHANDFHTLGLAFDQQTSNLFIANHAQAGSRIEMFNLDIGSLTARYIQTIEHPLLHGPNSIAIVNSHELYVSNDHHITKRQSAFISSLETYLGTPTGTVVHVSLKESEVQAKVVARVPFANGIEILNSSTVAVASSSRGAIYLFDTPNPTIFKYNSKILLPFLPDNLSGSGEKLMIAGHGHIPSLAKFTHSRRVCNDPAEFERADSKAKELCKTAKAPSWAAEWTESEGLKNLFFTFSDMIISISTKTLNFSNGLFPASTHPDNPNQPPNMPISKKDRRNKEHKKADAAGTRAAVKPNGLPVKPPKPTSICQNCRKEIVNTNKLQLEVHASTHDAKLWPKEKCWPNDFQ
ncbi:serum paraoxonase lactonase 3 [Fusarium longipes]|uniref:Serum paraoxonase lactonase 3 n=1 Tax=Fusarium longipes TaxID=694270 RepID=A0A395T300_9HYPO|nr:serum paraoxonase lactonase 3 [Fusarium longipes]